ncbi:hypothetical protein BpHYR1_012454 [Brachionus plicatilis]|uniref:Uncharacterized protein n=1 Tax=Brachionus plicatilis TaxID=10195 RepID=A0A3M7RJQ7_BRAPC|nr:hypothetical protein BpHYR1_012454 [Brachionus plicatilis]
MINMLKKGSKRIKKLKRLLEKEVIMGDNKNQWNVYNYARQVVDCSKIRPEHCEANSERSFGQYGQSHQTEKEVIMGDNKNQWNVYNYARQVVDCSKIRPEHCEANSERSFGQSL